MVFSQTVHQEACWSWLGSSGACLRAAVHTKVGDYGLVLAQFLPRFPSQIWVSDVIFVTFFCHKKRDVLHLSQFWEECDALAHGNNFFQLVTFLVASFPKNVTFWSRWYKTFLNGKKCDNLAGTETCFSLPVLVFSLILEA